MKKWRISVLVCALAAWCGAESHAAQSTNSVDSARSQAPLRLAVKAGRLLDVRSGNVASNAIVLIEGDRITHIGSEVPPGVRLLDLSGLTVLPGLVDCHAHILGNPKDESPTADLRMSSAQAALWGVHNLQIWLEHGFTCVRDAGQSDLGYGQLALRDSVQRGLITGPRIVSAGNFISVSGGHGDADVLAPDQALPRRPNLADTVEDVGRAVRHDLKYGVDWVKLMATGGVMDPMSDYRTQELSQEQMTRAVELAHRAGKRVMAHAEGTEGIKAAVRAGVDSIEHGTVLDEEGAALMATRGTWLVPTLFTFQHGVEIRASHGADPVSVQKGKAILELQQPAFALALKHHLRIAYGVDDDPEFVAKEFGALVRGGMTPLQAIQAATLNAAELLGLAKDIGALEPGKFADLVGVEGDPLADVGAMEHVVFVMKGGGVIKHGTPAVSDPR